MRVLQFFHHLDVVELNVEVLIHRLERPPNLNVVFEFHRDLVVDERLEKAAKVHGHVSLLV